MSDFYQKAFNGGMNILEDDTRLKPNEYRLALNLRNRFGKLLPVKNGVEDVAAPVGLKQEIRTWGNFVILFCAGKCYYRYYSATGWTQIISFSMSPIAPRFWTEVVPVATMLYLRKATDANNVQASVEWDSTVGSTGGNISGLLVQDNVNQPYIIYIDPSTQQPTTRPTQTYAQWDETTDKREYVPIGNSMAWVDGILYIASQDFETIYRSVSGRPLDFVVNITTAGAKGGDATTTAYSVGVGGITCLRALSSDALFVAASNANFAVSKNTSPNAPTIFGEHTFIRTFLFNAVCLSDRVIIDSLGDTRFVGLTGIRSFNAIQQLQSEGRNSSFSANIQAVFNNIIQLSNRSAAILYDDYEFYGVQTILGPAIAVFDTISQSWCAFDLEQTGGSLVKMFAKIELTVQRLYAITTDDKIYTLFDGTEYAPLLRILSASPDTLRIDGNEIPADWEHKLTNVRLTFSGVRANFTASITPVAQHEGTKTGTITKAISYTAPTIPYTGRGALNDAGTNIKNILFTTPDCAQSCQTYCVIEWTSNAELLQFGLQAMDIQPMNALRSQS